MSAHCSLVWQTVLAIRCPVTAKVRQTFLGLVAAGKSAALHIPEGHTLAVAVLHGSVLVNGRDTVRADQVAHLSTQGSQVLLEANNDSTLLVLSGTPIAEPIVGYGPFVMNSEEEIRMAITDFNSGKFGQIQAAMA